MKDEPRAIRRAVASDAPEVAELWLRSRRAAIPSIPSPPHDDDDVRCWIGEVVVPRGDTWVMGNDDGLVALLVLEDDWIDHLYVDPAWTGRGLGTALVEFAKAARPAGLTCGRFRRTPERGGSMNDTASPRWPRPTATTRRARRTSGITGPADEDGPRNPNWRRRVLSTLII